MATENRGKSFASIFVSNILNLSAAVVNNVVNPGDQDKSNQNNDNADDGINYRRSSLCGFFGITAGGNVQNAAVN